MVKIMQGKKMTIHRNYDHLFGRNQNGMEVDGILREADNIRGERE